MKTRLLIIIAIGILPAIPASFASCIVNEDWSEAPCLDTIANGWYNQDEVDQWTNYYSYKGSIFMEAKYLELSEAIKEDKVEEWTEESIENRNVYEYYFFSGRAPNTGEYRGLFDIIPINELEAVTYVQKNKEGTDVTFTVKSYFGTINSFEYKPEENLVAFEMPFDWSKQNLSDVTFVHEEVSFPKDFADFLTPSYIGRVNGIDLFKSAIMIDDYSEQDVRIVHFMLTQDHLNLLQRE